MAKLLGRRPTPEERAFEVLLRRALGGQEKRLARSSLRDLAERSPGLFVSAALSMLDSETSLVAQRKLYLQLLECPKFLLELINPNRLSETEFLRVCRGLKQIDDFLDLRLARLVPGRHSDDYELPREIVLRLLNVIHAISSGPRLVQVLSHLTHHPEERVASKATMLMGHRIRSANWLRSQFQSSSARQRASVVEGLWGVDTPFARKCMQESLNDSNNRVVGNALVGLHLLGDVLVDKSVEEMLGDARPDFRRTAAWVMGKMGKPEFTEALERAAQDEDPGVREMATRVLEALRVPAVEVVASVAPEEVAESEDPNVEVMPPDVEPVAPKETSPEEEALPTATQEQIDEPGEAPEETPPPEPVYIPIPTFSGKYIRGL